MSQKVRQWEVTVPLLNLRSELPVVHLGDGFEIVPFTQEEKDEFLAWAHSVYHHEEVLEPEQFQRVHARLRKTFALNMWDTPEGDETRASIERIERIERIVTAIRLHKAGETGAWMKLSRAPALEPDPNDWLTPGDVAGGYLSDEYRTRRDASNLYFVNEDDITEINRLTDALDGDAWQQLEVALRRFNLSYSREHEDRIIDLIIALDASLLKNARGSYRLALRGAALLADTMDPVKVRKFLSGMYDIRNRIVHEGWSIFDPDKNNPLRKAGKNPQPDDLFPSIVISEYAQYCESVVRAVLVEYLRHLQTGKSLQEINTELDNRIVAGLKTSE